MFFINMSNKKVYNVCCFSFVDSLLYIGSFWVIKLMKLGFLTLSRLVPHFSCLKDRWTHQRCACEDWPVLSSPLLLLTAWEVHGKPWLLAAAQNIGGFRLHVAAWCPSVFAVEHSCLRPTTLCQVWLRLVVCSKVGMRYWCDHVRTASLQDCSEEGWGFFHLWLPSCSSWQPWHLFWPACLLCSTLLTFWFSVHV